MKPLAQGAILIGIFLIVLFASRQVNWMELLHVKEAQSNTEEKLGELIWETFNKTSDEIKDPKITDLLDSIVSKICKANKIDRDKIKVHLLDLDQVNAFALPGDHLVVFSGLIESADDPDEVAGVICHELAHIELNHVMQKLVKEIGLATLVSMAGGNSGGQVIKETARLLSSSAFDREIEKEADIQAVEYLAAAEIATEPFANFLYKIGENSSEYMDYMSWISTHPNPKERAEYVLEYSESFDYDTVPSLDSASWTELNLALEAYY